MPHARWSFVATMPSGRDSGGAAAMLRAERTAEFGGGPSRPDDVERGIRMSGDRQARALQALAHLADLFARTEEGDAAPTGLEQVLGREASAGDIVERHRRR